MNSTANMIQRAASTAPLALAPLNAKSLRHQAYVLLKSAIAGTDIDPSRNCAWMSGS